VKNEKVPRTAGSIIKMEIIEKEEPLSFKSSESSSSINLSNLLNCIQNIRQSQPSRINAACCFYMDDTHDDCVTSATISPNSELLSFTTENSSTRLYKLYANNDASAGDGGRAQPRFFQELVGGHSGPIFESKFTHDSKFLISCGDDGQACLWNIHNPQVVPSNNKDTARNESEESEDYANESADETTDQDLFDFKITKATAADRGGLTEPERILPVCCYSGHTQPVWDVEPFSRLNLFATASRDATARLWSFDRVYPLRNYCGHHSDVNCVRFHPNGAYLATGSSDKTVRLWSVQSGEFVRVFPSHRSRVFSLAFSPDGNYIASSGEDRKIKVWDIRSGACVKEFKGHTDIVHALEFDNSSDVLCSGGLDRTVKFWNVHGRNVVIEPDFNSSIMKQRAAGMRGGSSAAQSASGGTAGCSSELMRSVNLGFNVYSISVDLQNVFYFLGARKSLGGSGLSQRMDQAGLIAAKKEPVHTDKPASQQRLSSSVGSMSSQTTSAGLSEATFNNNNNNNNNNGSYSTTSSSYLSTRARAKPTLTQSAATTPTNQSSSVVTPPANEESLSTKSAINTRRRAAAASASSQHQSQSQSSQSLPANSTNYLLDNDDLYEV
jgi:WD40 repeat protein